MNRILRKSALGACLALAALPGDVLAGRGGGYGGGQRGGGGYGGGQRGGGGYGQASKAAAAVAACWRGGGQERRLIDEPLAFDEPAAFPLGRVGIAARRPGRIRDSK